MLKIVLVDCKDSLKRALKEADDGHVGMLFFSGICVLPSNLNLTDNLRGIGELKYVEILGGQCRWILRFWQYYTKREQVHLLQNLLRSRRYSVTVR